MLDVKKKLKDVQAFPLKKLFISAEIGDYNPRICYDGYVSEFRFVPNQTQELEEQISRFHQHLGYSNFLLQTHLEFTRLSKPERS